MKINNQELKTKLNLATTVLSRRKAKTYSKTYVSYCITVVD